MGSWAREALHIDAGTFAQISLLLHTNHLCCIDVERMRM